MEVVVTQSLSVKYIVGEMKKKKQLKKYSKICLPDGT